MTNERSEPETQSLDRNHAEDALPQSIGPYKILEVLGEGGMGVVYLAEQTKPIRRRVALKIIKLGMDTKQVIARFESERQALALMNHPNVAKVFDAGSTEQGRSYFVMEHVAGIRITDYCDRHRLNTTERLDLFTHVCHAVQHAHQKGIIHRDIKPSNVLVAVQEGKPVPKVIDFGVAKATEKRLTERTLFTEQGQLIGTPEYMSPEQAEMTALDIDTRTDIYSLGVVLYELLVGALPFARKSLRQAGMAEIQRIIREEEPPKPSTRLSSLGDESTTVAQKRHTDRTTLERQVRGDLDWITMKAMEKDRTRRYATASELADDIAHHLNHEPVLASPPSAGYRLKKFVRRNRTAVTASGVVSVVLVAAVVVSAWQAVRALQAEQLAGERLKQTEEARALAEREAAHAKAVNNFVNDDLLAAIAPAKQGLDTAHEVLDAASKNIEGKFRDKPLVEASIRMTLANTYWDLGEYETAVRHAERAFELRLVELGEEHPDTLKSMDTLAMQYKYQGQYDKAEPLYLETLETRRSILGDEDPDTVESMINLAVLLRSQGRLDEAEALHRQALSIVRRVLGDEDRRTLSSMANLAVLLWEKGELDEAERLARKTLETRQRVLSEDHTDTLQSMHSLAVILSARGERDEAERLFRRTLEIARRVFGDEHPRVASILSNLGALLTEKGDYGPAEAMFREALTMRRRLLHEEDPHTGDTMSHFGECLTKLGQYEEGEQQLLEGYRMLMAALGESHWRTTRAAERLGALYDAWGKPDKTAAWRARAKPADGSSERSLPEP